MFEYFTIRECGVLWSLEMCRCFEETYCLQLQKRKSRLFSIILSRNSTCREKQAKVLCSVPRYILTEIQRLLKVKNRQYKGGYKIKNRASF